jgi:hypothetical protein
MATKKRVSKSRSSRVAQFPTRKISPSDLKGPKPTPKQITIPNFFGEGESGTLYFLPLPLNLSWKIKPDITPENMGRVLAEQLSQSIVNEDSSPMMSVDEWGEMTFERLLDISTQIMRAASEENDSGNG